MRLFRERLLTRNGGGMHRGLMRMVQQWAGVGVTARGGGGGNSGGGGGGGVNSRGVFNRPSHHKYKFPQQFQLKQS